MRKRQEKRKIGKWLYWTPRVLSFLFLLFLAMFSLDIFDSCKGFLDCALGLFMHNLPVIILALILWISWKREWIAGIAFILGGILYTGLSITRIIMSSSSEPVPWYMLSWSLIIAGPAFLVGILFFVNWYKKR